MPSRKHSFYSPLFSYPFKEQKGICGLVFVSFFVNQLTLVSIYAASALATNAIIRSIAAALIPLAGLPMYRTLGLGWGNTLLGFIALALLPVAFLLIKYGEYLRNRFPVKNL